MGIPVVYRKSSENAIASYNYTDIASGTGVVRYNLLANSISGSTIYFLSSSVTDANPVYVDTNATSSATHTKDFDTDFDLTMNKPQIINGTAYANYTIMLQDISGSSTTSFYSIVKVVHVTASGTETVLGSASSPVRTLAAGASPSYYREAIKMTLTQKKFKINEKLRVIVEGWAVEGGVTPNSKFRFYLDPSSRLSVTDTEYSTTCDTNFYIDIPFKIDV